MLTLVKCGEEERASVSGRVEGDGGTESEGETEGRRDGEVVAPALLPQLRTQPSPICR